MTVPERLSPDNTVQRAPDVIVAAADEELVMVSIENGCYYGVSNVAREIWESIEQPKKISDLIEALMATYRVDKATCEGQTLSLLEELRTEKLLLVK